MIISDVRDLVEARAGWTCEVQIEGVCDGTLTGPFGRSLHHRRPRGMGGTRRVDASTPSNFLMVCGSGVTGCHGWIESHRYWALEHGLLVPQRGTPVDVPVSHYKGTQVVYLTDDGRVVTEKEST